MLVYVFGTSQNKEIYICQKYQFTRDSHTEFMVVD